MPDLKTKHTLEVGESRFDLDTGVPDIGESKVGVRTVSGKSGVVIAILASQVDDPELETEHSTHVGPDASEVSIIATIYSTAVA